MAKEYLLSSVHVHTKLCDGKNTPEELALSAWKAGLKTLGFSGHSHTPHDIEYCMTNARTQLYRAQVAKLKERYAGKLDILCGLEWDLYSDDDPAAYDYWIGSAHYVKGPKTGKYYEIDWREADLAACIQDDFDGDGLAVVETYFANVAAVAAKKPTILGHFDLIKKVNGSGKFFDESDPRYTAAAHKALEAAAQAGCVLEVNTSSVYRGFREDYFPSPAILKEWLTMGGNVTITADAHEAKALTFGFEEAAAQLKERLTAAGLRVKLDDSDNSPGWKFAEYEMKGVPVRVEIGPRDLEKGQCCLARRDTGEKSFVSLDELEAQVQSLMTAIHDNLYAQAEKNLEDNTFDLNSWQEVKEMIFFYVFSICIFQFFVVIMDLTKTGTPKPV